MRVFPLVAGISMVTAATNMTLVGSGTAITDKALRARQEVTSGGFGTTNPAPVTSGGSGTTNPAPVTSGGFGTDDTAATQQLSTIEGALLMKGNTQTLCEVIMMTPRYGVVAASCLDYVNGQVDPNAGYVLGMSKNLNDIDGNLQIETVIPHPNYNPDTFENNIAVVMAKVNPAYNFQNMIADWPLDWNQYYFVHRSQTEGPLYSWNLPTVSVTNGTNSINLNLAQCTAGSTLYNANQDKFICNQQEVTYYYNRTCSLPYGAVYIGHENTVAAAAVFSHSAIYGDGGFCGGGKMVNYYIVIRDYIKWINQVSGLDVPVYHSAGPAGYTASSDANFVMKAPAAADAADIHIYGKFTMDTIAAVESGADTESEVQSESSDTVEAVVASDNIDSIVVTQTDVSTDTSTVITTDITTQITTQLTTDITTELATSTGVITSTTIETSSTTETLTTTVDDTNMATATVTATAIFSNNPLNPTASLIITPQFYTQSVTVHDTITQTVTEGEANQQTNVPDNTQGGAKLVTETETETVTFTEQGNIIETDNGLMTIFANQMETTVTVSVFSTIVNDVSENVPATTTVTITAVPEAYVVTSFITLTDMSMETVTSDLLPTASSNKDHYRETDMPVESLDFESESESNSAAADNSNSPSKLVVGLILALVILLLIFCGILYYICIYKKKKARRINDEYVNEGYRVDRWAYGSQAGHRSYVDAPPDYASHKC